MNYNVNKKNMSFVQIVCLSENGTIPVRSSHGAAGYDVYSSCSGTIPPKQRLLIPLDISIELPPGHYGHIVARSGLAVRNGIQVMAGIIDEDYRGNVGVLLYNSSDTEYSFSKGERIAQMIIKRYEIVEFITKETVTETQRGTNGFGSTGK